MEIETSEDCQFQIEQSGDLPISPLTVKDNLALGGIALGTMICMTVLIREIRLLVQAGRS